MDAHGRFEREYGLGRRRTDFLVPWPVPPTPPSEETDLPRRAEWREAVDACQLLTSPSYHLVRFLATGPIAVPWVRTRSGCQGR